MMIRKLFFYIGIPVLFLSFANFAFSQESPVVKPKLLVFHSLTCHSCIKTKKEIMPLIEAKFKDKIVLEYKDIADIDNYKLLIGLQEKHQIKLSDDLPVFYLEGNFLNGETTISKEWGSFISQSLQSLEKNDIQQDLPQVDLISRFKTFKPVAIALAGLIDGINPCVFTVIVFFLSFLAVQKYTKKEMLVIGLAFIFAVFLAYTLAGIGLFSFLYRFANFLLLAKIFNLLTGFLSIILGILAVYDFYKYKKTNNTEGLILQLPAAMKKRIHSIIGTHYRQSGGSQGQVTSQSHILRLVLSAFIVGFLISIHEAVCTGQIYLPTIAFVLKTTPLKVQALGYLLLYNFVFVMPLLAILGFALLGTTALQFSAFLRKRLAVIKILMAVLFFTMGALLIWRA